ncbi:helix-turn-helix transcriptional regulator [Alkaliphilus pronyensis]|uniref:Helix-turn-helix transcriptional regulator n=1 Tax=Alkaliphilus pronyensis TaxID=1482732 RepID=A0A6I0FAP6_9FIRM|nr:helix-turn-helix transcriptional regulator [Alkaliphilus pronyensis]KAB3534422.1 helix-turn-helix transcriptional regulator [Alkaliphilus pronyensis]
MAIKFYKLMDQLNRKEISKGDLQSMTGISSATVAKLSAHKTVSLDVIDKICQALNCQPGDIMEYVPDPEE